MAQPLDQTIQNGGNGRSASLDDSFAPSAYATLIDGLAVIGVERKEAAL
jgi:hypothetical protein